MDQNTANYYKELTEKNKQIELDFFNENKGNLLINSSLEIVRLIAIAEDGIDFMYVLLDKDNELRFESTVLKLHLLKGKIEDDSYNYFIRMHKINFKLYPEYFGDKDVKKYLEYRNDIILKLKDKENSGTIKLLTEVHLDLD